jgi:hypothetical protein
LPFAFGSGALGDRGASALDHSPGLIAPLRAELTL